MSTSTWARRAAIINQSCSTKWPWCGWLWYSSETPWRVHYWTCACNYISISKPILLLLLSFFIDKLLCNCGFPWTCANSNALYYCRLVWEGKWGMWAITMRPMWCKMKWIMGERNKQRNPKQCEREYRFLVLEWRVLWAIQGHKWTFFVSSSTFWPSYHLDYSFLCKIAE